MQRSQVLPRLLLLHRLLLLRWLLLSRVFRLVVVCQLLLHLLAVPGRFVIREGAQWEVGRACRRVASWRGLGRPALYGAGQAC